MADKWTRALCKRLGVTPAGLQTLAKAEAGRPVSGQGAGYSAQGAKSKLIREGYLESFGNKVGEWGEDLRITDKGREVVRRARAAGW